MRRPEYEKTWGIFKDTLTNAHQELRDKDTTFDALVFDSANAIVTQIVVQLRDEILAPEDPPPHQPPHPPAPENLPKVIPGVANAIQQADSAIRMLMQTTMASMEAMRLMIKGNENNMFNRYGRDRDKDDSYAYGRYRRGRG